MKKERPGKKQGKNIKQLDYYTGELIYVYESIQDAAYDNWVASTSLSMALNKNNGYMNQKKLRFEFC